MDCNSEAFNNALKENDIETLRKIPKSDLHNHLSRGANKHDLEKWLKVKVPAFNKVNSVFEMDSWYKQYIKGLTMTKETFELKIKSAFLEATRENIKVLCLSIGPGDMQYFNNSMQKFINTIEKYRKELTPDIAFIPELSLCRTENNDFNQYQINTALNFLNLNYFMSIDLVGDENISSAPFKELFRICKARGMLTKVHIGEFTLSEKIFNTITELDVIDIQHGTSASESPELMRFLKEKDITLHICPTSNVMLNRTKDYTFPQLRTLIDNDVKVTINTDDLLIFDSTVSEEYLKLYQSGNFTVGELDSIRLHGLSYAGLFYIIR